MIRSRPFNTSTGPLAHVMFKTMIFRDEADEVPLDDRLARQLQHVRLPCSHVPLIRALLLFYSSCSYFTLRSRPSNTSPRPPVTSRTEGFRGNWIRYHSMSGWHDTFSTSVCRVRTSSLRVRQGRFYTALTRTAVIMVLSFVLSSLRQSHGCTR